MKSLLVWYVFLEVLHFGASKECGELLLQLNLLHEASTELYETHQNQLKFLTDQQYSVRMHLNYLQENLNQTLTTIQEIESERCDASSVFLENLKDRQEALDTVNKIQEDLKDLTQANYFQVKKQLETLDPALKNSNSDLETLISELKEHIKYDISQIEDSELQVTNDFISWNLKMKTEKEDLHKQIDQQSQELRLLEDKLKQLTQTTDFSNKLKRNSEFALGTFQELCDLQTQLKTNLGNYENHQHQLIASALEKYLEEFPDQKYSFPVTLTPKETLSKLLESIN